MRKKKLHLILTIFSLVVFCAIALLFMGCKEGFQRDRGAEYAAGERLAEKEEELLAEKEEERLVKEEEKQTEAEEAPPAEEVEVTEENTEEEKPIPSEPISYSGSANEAAVILIVDFKTIEVSGSISLTGENNINATITDGKINIDTFEINTKYSGTGRLEAEGEDYQVNGTISGKISDDLSTFQGTIKSDYEDEGVEFIAAKDS